jgi:hypothetical protein
MLRGIDTFDILRNTPCLHGFLSGLTVHFVAILQVSLANEWLTKTHKQALVG